MASRSLKSASSKSLVARLSQRLALTVLLLVTAVMPVYAQQDPIPFKPEIQSTETILLKIFLLLMFVSAIAYGIVYLLKRYYQGGVFSKVADGKIKVVELKKISINLSVYRIEIKDREYYLAQSGTNLIVLDNDKINELQK